MTIVGLITDQHRVSSAHGGGIWPEDQARLGRASPWGTRS